METISDDSYFKADWLSFDVGDSFLDDVNKKQDERRRKTKRPTAKVW